MKQNFLAFINVDVCVYLYTYAHMSVYMHIYFNENCLNFLGLQFYSMMLFKTVNTSRSTTNSIYPC